MLIGINYPWINYGWDFGDPPPSWVPVQKLAAWRERKLEQIDMDFALFASQGISAVRWFLLGDGLNFGMDELAPRKTSGKWTFDPLPAGHSFYERIRDDLESVLEICRVHGLKLFPSLIDFHWCRGGKPVPGKPGIIKGGRQDIVRDREKGQAFFDRLLDPLLESSARYQGSVYAWEVINEPEWVVRKGPVFREKDGRRSVSQQEMREFILEGVRRINAKQSPDGSAAFPSSVGFAHWKSLEEWDADGLAITLHQFHYYAQGQGDLPEYSDLKIHPCVIGEFATAMGREWPDLKQLDKDQSTGNKLCRIEEKGYPACFMWSARAVDKSTRWTEEEHRQVIAYTGAGKPDGLGA
jgi:hypothetical protein